VILIVAMISAVLGAIIPAWRAARMHPVDARDGNERADRENLLCFDQRLAPPLAARVCSY